jgi:hypothetical protein
VIFKPHSFPSHLNFPCSIQLQFKTPSSHSRLKTINASSSSPNAHACDITKCRMQMRCDCTIKSSFRRGQCQNATKCRTPARCSGDGPFFVALHVDTTRRMAPYVFQKTSSILSLFVDSASELLADFVTADHNRTRWCDFQAPSCPAAEETGHAFLAVNVPQETRHGAVFR